MSTRLSRVYEINTPARGHYSLGAHATRNLIYYSMNVWVFILFYFNLGLNLGAVHLPLLDFSLQLFFFFLYL